MRPILRECNQLDLYVVLVSTQNQRSINAHIKLGMENVGSFLFKNSDFVILAVPIEKCKF